MKIVFSILILFLICCSNYNKINNQFIGNYKSPENNTLNKLKYGVFVTDIKLELKKDSSFISTTCSQVTEGKWEYKDNNLVLICKKRSFIINSLNSIEKFQKGAICDGNEIFKVKNNSLTREFKINNKTVKIVLVNE